MDRELLYLHKRLNFHRRMAREANGAEARCAHDRLVRAYEARIGDLTRQEAEPDRVHRPILSLPMGK